MQSLHIPIVFKKLIPPPSPIPLLKTTRVHFFDTSFDAVHTYLVWRETYDGSELVMCCFEGCIFNCSPAHG